MSDVLALVAVLVAGLSAGSVAGAWFGHWSTRRYWLETGYCDICGRLSEITRARRERMEAVDE